MPRLDLTFLTISPMLGIDTVLVVRLWRPSAKSIWKTFDQNQNRGCSNVLSNYCGQVEKLQSWYLCHRLAQLCPTRTHNAIPIGRKSYWQIVCVGLFTYFVSRERKGGGGAGVRLIFKKWSLRICGERRQFKKLKSVCRKTVFVKGGSGKCWRRGGKPKDDEGWQREGGGVERGEGVFWKPPTCLT